MDPTKPLVSPSTNHQRSSTIIKHIFFRSSNSIKLLQTSSNIINNHQKSPKIINSGWCWTNSWEGNGPSPGLIREGNVRHAGDGVANQEARLSNAASENAEVLPSIIYGKLYIYSIYIIYNISIMYIIIYIYTYIHHIIYKLYDRLIDINYIKKKYTKMIQYDHVNRLQMEDLDITSAWLASSWWSNSVSRKEFQLFVNYVILFHIMIIYIYIILSNKCHTIILYYIIVICGNIILYILILDIP